LDTEVADHYRDDLAGRRPGSPIGLIRRIMAASRYCAFPRWRR